jgi:hypothetical protein
MLKLTPKFSKMEFYVILYAKIVLRKTSKNFSKEKKKKEKNFTS